MKLAMPGMVIVIIAAFIMLFIAPMYSIGVINWARSENEVMSEARNLIDEVIDTRVLTKDKLADFNLAVASTSEYYSVSIYREVKVVNPDPVNPGKTYTSYMMVDNISVYSQGDYITVVIEPVGKNIFRTIAKALMNLDIPDDDIQFTGRVR